MPDHGRALVLAVAQGEQAGDRAAQIDHDQEEGRQRVQAKMLAQPGQTQLVLIVLSSGFAVAGQMARVGRRVADGMLSRLACLPVFSDEWHDDPELTHAPND